MQKLVAQSLNGLANLWRSVKQWLLFSGDASGGNNNQSTETSGAPGESIGVAAQPQADAAIVTDQGLTNGKETKRQAMAKKTVEEAKEKVTEMCRSTGLSDFLCNHWWKSIKGSWTTRVPSRKRQRRTTDGNIGSAGVANEEGAMTLSTSNSDKSVAASSGSEVTAPQRQTYTFTTTTITSSITVGSGSKGLDKQQNVEVREETKPAPSSPEKGTPSAGTHGHARTSYLSCTSNPASNNGNGPTPSCRSVYTYRSVSEYKQGDSESAKVSKLKPIPFYQKATFWLMGLITYTSEVPLVTGYPCVSRIELLGVPVSADISHIHRS
ncbi:hypothetical protein BgAZ_405020 [Babesia gibsoni]|uniref:Uncharacterized protein n=1 Tax=Babesia gibsoni TaxID=33632 RepID=A0AAD8PDL1_BABGI|nr:hypothetical protein BgAZ_405020 [Babesia gibsoni]